MRIDLTDAVYEGKTALYFLIKHGWSGKTSSAMEITGVSGGSANLDNLTWTGPEVISYNDAVTFPLNASNSWQFEFTGLNTESPAGETPKYFYKYTVVETDTSKQTSRIVTGGTEITLEDDSTTETGGNVVITNNKE